MKILVCYTYVSEKHSHGMGDTIVTMTGQLTEYAVNRIRAEAVKMLRKQGHKNINVILTNLIKLED